VAAVALRPRRLRRLPRPIRLRPLRRHPETSRGPRPPTSPRRAAGPQRAEEAVVVAAETPTQSAVQRLLPRHRQRSRLRAAGVASRSSREGGRRRRSCTGPPRLPRRRRLRSIAVRQRRPWVPSTSRVQEGRRAHGKRPRGRHLCSERFGHHGRRRSAAVCGLGGRRVHRGQIPRRTCPGIRRCTDEGRQELRAQLTF